MITLPVWAFALIGVLMVLLAIVVVWAIGMANRLNRLHIRTDSARISLEGALSARASVIAALQPELGWSAQEASRVPLRANDMSHRTDAENGLLAELTSEVMDYTAFIEASTRVDLAARFYNEAVAATLSVRLRPVVRLFRLAGRAPLPQYYEALSAGQSA